MNATQMWRRRLVLLLLVFCTSRGNEWDLGNRFQGFRFEIIGKVQGVGYRRAAQIKAQELHCFGWIQNTVKSSIVGEVRCSKERGQLFLKWLETGPPTAKVENVEVKIYKDTKIHLHYSHFRILDNDIRSCFVDKPHQCLLHTSEDENVEGNTILERIEQVEDDELNEELGELAKSTHSTKIEKQEL